MCQTLQDAFALAGGTLAAARGLFTTQQYAFSYASPQISVSVDAWNPALVTAKLNPCNGSLQLLMRTVRQLVKLTITARPDTFTTVVCPTSQGFKEYSMESFRATANLVVWDGVLPWSNPQLEAASVDVLFENAAFELGGTAMCTQLQS